MIEREIIGRTEYANFPDLGLHNVIVKVDTGAYTSSIHCSSIECIENNKVQFIPLDSSILSFTGETIELPILKRTNVKSSNGEIEERFVVETVIEINGKSNSIRFSLTYRGDMKFPVLIGRRFLAKKYLVDVTKKKH